jgi:hypothetical protein
MRPIGLLGLILVFLLGGCLGCGDSEPKKVEENPMKARQESQKEKSGLMPKGVKPNK